MNHLTTFFLYPWMLYDALYFFLETCFGVRLWLFSLGITYKHICKHWSILGGQCLDFHDNLLKYRVVLHLDFCFFSTVKIVVRLFFCKKKHESKHQFYAIFLFAQLSKNVSLGANFLRVGQSRYLFFPSVSFIFVEAFFFATSNLLGEINFLPIFFSWRRFFSVKCIPASSSKNFKSHQFLERKNMLDNCLACSNSVISEKKGSRTT